ncbi:MAG: hypothetical protein LW688_03260 [Cryomorphaceae bacterium]|jgi:hypothetical protein|nr:hypothetical protein [Cryomorphaceae bacterium]
MKVHLLRSNELDAETYSNVLNLLRQWNGPVEFISGESELELNRLLTRVWENEEDFELKACYSVEPNNRSYAVFPMEEQYQTWDFFFDQCGRYRLENGIDQNEQIFLLTNLGNDKNWFGAVHENRKDYFIQTSGWEHYFGSKIDIRFPIAYEVVIWLIRQLMFDDRNQIIKNVHQQSRGCGNDFCQQKREIILKMRTADLCHDCIDQLKRKDVSPHIVEQLFGIMEGIRQGIMYRERIKVFHKPSRLELRGHMKRLFLPDLGDLELRFNPKEKTLYLFYLNHPEGVHLTHLQNHREEITRYYQLFTNNYNRESIERSINLLLDPLDNDINVILSRIKRKLKDAVGEQLLGYYMIDGQHGEDKKILLDREYVTIVD